MGNADVLSRSSFDPSHPPVLAIYCSDGRFTDAVEDLARALGHGRIDTLTLPGGPGLLNLATAGFAESDVLSRATTFLVRGHAIREILLVAHAGCGYYRAHLEGRSADEIVAQQHDDLRAAARTLRLGHVGVRVRAWFADVGDGRVRFRPIALEGGADDPAEGTILPWTLAASPSAMGNVSAPPPPHRTAAPEESEVLEAPEEAEEPEKLGALEAPETPETIEPAPPPPPRPRPATASPPPPPPRAAPTASRKGSRNQ